MNYSIIIKRLIELKHEGDYWDFKRQWHNNTADLVHDILCMANNPKDCEKYIIIGVDEEKNYKLRSVSKDDRRKNTSNLNDLLRNISFVGGVRPFVRVETLVIKNKKIDIIIIEDSTNVPFVLSEDYSSGAKNNQIILRQGNIYTRVGDSNTPKNKTADNDIVEKLWRKHFFMDKTPLEKLGRYLRDVTGWGSDENRENFYYKYAPEYTISFDYDQEDLMKNQDFLCKMYIDNKGTYNTASIKVYGSPIKHIDYAFLDGSRFVTVRPYFYNIMPENSSRLEDHLIMAFLDSDSIEYGFYLFLLLHLQTYDTYHREEWLKHVIIFRDSEERRHFVDYVRNNFAAFQKEAANINNRIPLDKSGNWNEFDDEDWRHSKFLVEKHREWVQEQ